MTARVETKRVPGVPDEEGAFSARVYLVEGPPDGDGDVILRGAIEDGVRVVVSAGAHDVIRESAEAGGSARLYHEGNAVVAIGRAFDTERGRLLRQKLREPRVEWSLGFRVIKARPPTREERARHPATRRIIERWIVDEISPVAVGSCGPVCTTLSAKDAKCSPDAPCAQCAQREAVVKELARFEFTRFQLARSAAKRRLDEIDSDRAVLEQHELRPSQVPAEMRRAAEEAAETAAKVLASDAPRIRWFDWAGALELEVKGVCYRGEGEIWLASRCDGDADELYLTALHECLHSLKGSDEQAAKHFGVSLALLRGVQLHVGPRKSFEGEVFRDPWRPGERIRRGSLPAGAAVVDGNVLYQKTEDGWRRVAELVPA